MARLEKAMSPRKMIPMAIMNRATGFLREPRIMSMGLPSFDQPDRRTIPDRGLSFDNHSLPFFNSLKDLYELILLVSGDDGLSNRLVVLNHEDIFRSPFLYHSDFGNQN